MREGYWLVAATGAYHLVDDHAMWIQRPENARALGLPEEVVEAIQAVRWDFNGPGRRQILMLAMDNGLIRSRGHGPAEVTFEFTIETEAAIRAVVPFMQATLGPASVPKFNCLRTGESLAFNFGNAKKIIEAGDISFLFPVWKRPTQVLPVRRPYVLLNDFDQMPEWTCWELPEVLTSHELVALIRHYAPLGSGWLALADGRTWRLAPNTPPLTPLETLNPELAPWACESCGSPTRGPKTPCQCLNLTLCRVCKLPPLPGIVPGKDTITLNGETLYVSLLGGLAHKCVHWPSVRVLPLDDLIRRGR
ncbi:MAG: hypothetical protein KA743_00395 [Geothrix sp.]|uniref:Uncharacterized protein n=1 Tax=Candidatus Geothrix odensensis TaxID=2954440 RepID=A0A936F195_9BACT|nr:hypothetical protein [Candidatus Geothrix odensensis]MBP7616940.1 hypothetical protein [Geothrix sp.]